MFMQKNKSHLGASKNRKISLFKALCLGSVSLCAVETAMAEDENEKILVLEEITVTARKMEEGLQNTPVSITALSAGALEARNLTNLSEVGNFSPNVFMSFTTGGSGSGSDALIYIRGVGQSDFLFTTDPGVGVYIDGVYYARTVGGVFDLLDLERVEILRGPQGTVFGKNTIGGAVNVISKKPTGETGAKASVTMGSFNRLDVRGSADVSVIEDKLFAKLSFSSKDRDGYGDILDFNTGKVVDHNGNENSTSARLALRWIPSDRTEVNLISDFTRKREQSTVRTIEFVDSSTGLAPLWNGLVGGPAGLPYTDAFVTGNPFTNYGTGPNQNDLNSWGINLTVDHEVSDNVDIKSITAYREFDAHFGRDGDGSPLNYVHTDDTQTQSQLSQEFQLSGVASDDKLNWLVGLFYFNEKGTDQNNVVLASGLFNALQGLPGTLNGSPLSAPTAPGGFGNPINVLLDLDFNINNKIDIKSYAVFAQATYDLTEKLSLSIGGRYSYEKKDYTLEHLRITSGAAIVPLSTISDNWGSFSPKASLDFQVTEDVMTYASISKGFKSGGFNGRPTTNAEVESFAPETVLAYEVGVKSQWADNRVRLNVAAFYNDYNDIQLGSVGADSTGNLILIIQNGGKAVVKGFEVELQAVPAQGLTIEGGIGYTDFGFTRLNPGVQDITLATQQANTPKWTTNLGVSYAIDMSNDATLTVRGDWSYSGSSYKDVVNTPQLKQKAYSLVNARITYEPSGANWSISALVTNLTDERYIVGGLSTLGSFGIVEAVYGRPREWGVSLGYEF
ncbi:TonB-dependent receptor [hydrothermal vent metagenome]|uniref:TonB-dependent receptor n=1 Tax=hydrothermal vent metagenome TaxID=652676 RepID=A0A3B0RYT1_9ZZZZ